jgi:CubicO group peptidase (beta-lactamase class C family)
MKVHSDKASFLLDKALDCEVASSLSLYIGNRDSDLAILHRGYLAKHPQVLTSAATLYDLASLTKIIGTTLAVAKACSDGLIDLKEYPFKSWPSVSVRQLLAHTSGLMAHRKFYLLEGISNNIKNNQQLIFNELFKTKPAEPPSPTRLYSDLNFMALGLLLERRYKLPLFEIFQKTWKSLDLEPSFCYFPERFATLDTNIAPTGQRELNEMRLRGVVNDQNCFALGGIAGHAGLFANLESVASMGKYLLKCYKNPDGPFDEMVRFFIRHNLGFDFPTKRGSVRHLSPTSFGHFGFTGTSLWIDPHANQGKGLIFVLLTNRVDKSLNAEPIFSLRENIHKLAYY